MIKGDYMEKVTHIDRKEIFKIEQQGENVFRNYDSHPSLIFYEGKFIYSSTDLNEAKTIIAHCTVE